MSSIRALYGARTDAVRKVADSADDGTRRARANARSLVYWEDGMGPLAGYIRQVYTSLPNQDDLLKIAEHTQTKNLLRRVSEETAMPLYARPPRRTIEPESANRIYDVIVEDLGLDAILDEVSAMVTGLGKVHVHPRWSEDLGLLVDVLEPGQMLMIPHPDSHLAPSGFAYSTKVVTPNGELSVWQVWDDTECWQQDSKGNLFRRPEMHPYGVCPFIPIGARPALRDYWLRRHNRRLEDATLQLWTVATQMLSVLRDQGHLQMVLEGDGDALPVSQSLGTRTVLRVLNTSGTPSTLRTIDLQAQLSEYVSAMEKVETGVAAEFGYSLDRLNQKTTLEADDSMLRARTEQLQQVMRQAERKLFEVIKVLVNAHHPTLRFPDDAELVAIDYGPIPIAPGVRKAILEIREMETRQGTASPLDFVMQDNAEIRTRDEAMEEFRQNIEDVAELARMRMQHNLRADANVGEQGQDPEVNGAMGPRVRDGNLSRDDAADRARGSVRG